MTVIVEGPLDWEDDNNPIVRVTNTANKEAWSISVFLDRPQQRIAWLYADYHPSELAGSHRVKVWSNIPTNVRAAYDRWYDMAYLSLAHHKLTGEFLVPTPELLNPTPPQHHLPF